MAGLKDRYRQHHGAILHGQTAFDVVLSEGGVLLDHEQPEAGEEEGLAGAVSLHHPSCVYIRGGRGAECIFDIWSSAWQSLAPIDK